MATDGIKIIDGDLAHDIYNEIMDLYDSDATLAFINHKVPFVKSDFGEDTNFYHEIFVTSYALAMWEIGGITDEIIEAVAKVIEIKAGVNVWAQGVNKLEGKKRQAELNRLWKKINQSNLKIRKRKKYKIIKNLYFQPDDLITFKTSDNMYHAVICANITQYRGQCTYDLVATTYCRASKPTSHDLLDCQIVGRTIGSGYDSETTLSYQPHVDEIWNFHKPATNFFFGLPYRLVTHKDIIYFVDKFEIIGKLIIRASFKRSGGYGYYSDFDEFERDFKDLDKYMRIFGQGGYPVTLLCEIQ